MGFNFGAFAGGLAKSGVDTYVRLSEEERRDAEAKRQSEIHALRLKEEAENDQLKAAYSETLGRAETPEAWKTAGGERGPVQQLGLPTTPVDPNQPAVSPEETAKMFPAQKMYSRDQATQDYRNKVMGINPIKGADVVSKMQGLRKGDLEISGLERSAKQDAAFDDYQNKLKNQVPKLRSDIETELGSNGLTGAVKKYGGEFTKITGYTPAVVGNELVIKDKDGKVIQKLSSHDDVLNGLTDVLGKKISQDALSGMLNAGVFRNPKEMQEYFLAQSTMRTQESNAAANTSNAATSAAQLAAQIKAGLFEAQAGQAKASANQANAHADVYRNMVKLGNENREAGVAVKDALAKYEALSDAEKAGEKGQAILTEGALAAAKKTGDITGIINMLKKPDRSTVTAEMEKAAYTLYNEAIASNDPKRVAAVKAAYPQVFGPSALDKALADKTKQPSQSAAPAPAATPTAIPTANAPAPAAALPASAPPVTKSTAYGKTGYQIKGVIGVFKSPEEAQAAWTQKFAPKAPAMFD